MSNGGSILDSIRGLFSSSSGGGSREDAGRERDPVRDRMERVEQIHSGVEMASSALADDMKGLGRESREAASAVLEAARSRVPEEDAAGSADSAGSGENLEDLSRCVDALEDLHYRLLQVEVHPEVQSDEEREQAADRARAAVQRAREVADSLTEATAA